MLPWRVQLQRLVEAFRDDAAFRNRLLGFVAVLALLVGAFSTGFSVEIQFGRSDSGTRLAGPGETITEDGKIVDRETGEVIGSIDEEGRRITSGTSTPGSGRTGPTAGTRSGTGPSSPSGTGGAAAGETGPGIATPASCDGAVLTKTDQGVDEKTIKLGFLIPNLNELHAAGFEAGLQGDFNKILDAWVKELNDNGGVACRQITYVKASFDVLSVDDMIAKCKLMTEDEKVFAVMTPGGYDSVAQLCIAKDHKTPFINPEPEPEDWYQQAAPYLWNLLMSKDRMHRNHVRWLVENGEIKPGSTGLTGGGTKVGVIYHGIPNVAPSVEKSLLPELQRHGIKPVEVAKLSSDSEQALTQINQAVLKFQQSDVQYVLMPMNLIFKTQFMQQAEAQNYFPKYTDSDHYFGCFDFVTGTYPAKSWNSTKCVSSVDVAGMRRADAVKLADEHPHGKYSDQVYNRAHPEGYDRNGEASQDSADTQRALHIGMGSQILLWKQAADRVGPNLTRPAWGESMGQTGVFDKMVSFTPLTFGPQKWDGPDHLVAVQWHAEAGDGYEERAYRRITDPFPVFY